jgi:hypothetical protein
MIEANGMDVSHGVRRQAIPIRDAAGGVGQKIVAALIHVRRHSGLVKRSMLHTKMHAPDRRERFQYQLKNLTGSVTFALTQIKLRLRF